MVYKARSNHASLYALKRMAVNNPEDLHLAKQEIAITVCLYAWLWGKGGGDGVCAYLHEYATVHMFKFSIGEMWN